MVHIIPLSLKTNSEHPVIYHFGSILPLAAVLDTNDLQMLARISLGLLKVSQTTKSRQLPIQASVRITTNTFAF